MIPDDVYGAWLTAGNNLQPVGAWISANWPNLAAAASLTVVAWRLIRWAIRPHIPAAPDNQPPADHDALIVCRRINRLQTVDPDICRRADRYAREKGEDRP